MTDEPIQSDTGARRHRLKLALAALGLIAAGGAAGTVASHALQPSVEMAPLRPMAIRNLPSASGIVTIRGRVAEIYGNKFVMDDGTAKALIDTGREGEGGTLVGIGAPVTIQGRFDRGFVHASFLVDPAGKVTALGPVGGPPHDRRGPPPPPRPGDASPPPPARNQMPPPPAAS